MQPTDEDMVAIKKILADYFSDKMKTKVQQAIDERGITENDLEKWINE
jgi:hypothetical protein